VDGVTWRAYEADLDRNLTDLTSRVHRGAYRALPLVAASGQDPPDRVWPLAAAGRTQRGLGKPETFKFLDFVFICGRTRKDKFQLKRKSRRDRMQAKLSEIKERLRRRMHQAIPEQGRWLAQVIRGYFAYHAVPTNFPALGAFRHHVKRLWLRPLRRRSQKDRLSWERMTKLADDFLPQPKILHPWPSVRFAVTTQGRSRML
jgi:RNA-directed DNA polymerase